MDDRPSAPGKPTEGEEAPPLVAPGKSIEGEKALLSAYSSTYNNLDTLCWSIPTRVFAGNLAVLTFIATHRPADVTDLILVVASLGVLAIINALGARALSKLWLDHTRMGYWIAVLEEDLAPEATSRKGLKHYWGASAMSGAAGYFTDRHETGLSFKGWYDSEYASASIFAPASIRRGLAWCRGLLARMRKPGCQPGRPFGARATNIMFMQFVAALLTLIAACSVIALVEGYFKDDPLLRLHALVRPSTSSVVTSRCIRRPGLRAAGAAQRP